MPDRLEQRTEVLTGWVVPPPPIRGLDHLGVQAPCIALYNQLLPGITNVTDRARYYSFYPWLIWSFERRYSDHSKDSFCRVLRRAECLLALIAAYHEAVLEDDEKNHGAATIGRQKLRSQGVAISQGEIVVLDVYSAFNGDRRYFKNRLGGLGQYYFGPLRDLKILDYVDNDRQKPPGYDRSRGVELAHAFDQAVASSRFFEVLEQKRIGPQELADLVSLCPCGLMKSDEERRLLLDIFFARTDQWRQDGGTNRRVSLALILDLINRHPRSPGMRLEDLLRGASYSRTLADGSAWTVGDKWLRVRDGWGVYTRNEILSVALQGIFWAQLRTAIVHGLRLRNAEEAGNLVRETALAALGDTWSTLTVGSAITRLLEDLPDIQDWSNERHEVSRAQTVVRLTRGDGPIEHVARDSTILLLSLLARGLRDNPYQEFELDSEYFSSRDIHLNTLRRWATEWESWNFGDWLSWMGRRWCVERHMHVALRKLRTENRDTFRIRPLDGELQIVEVPPAVFTAPRVTQAEQILRDLGLIEPRDNWYTLSDEGQGVLEECRRG